MAQTFTLNQMTVITHGITIRAVPHFSKMVCQHRSPAPVYIFQILKSPADFNSICAVEGTKDKFFLIDFIRRIRAKFMDHNILRACDDYTCVITEKKFEKKKRRISEQI